MAKLTKNDKKEIIKLYKKGNGYKTIATVIGLHPENIRKIIKEYELYGSEALKVHHKNKKYSPEDKLKLINRVLNGESISTVAYENMMSTGQLSNWIKKYKELDYNGLRSKPKGRPKIMKPETKKIKPIQEDEKDKRIRELEERNAQLEMENDLLKKLRALVQQRTQQQNKKK